MNHSNDKRESRPVVTRLVLAAIGLAALAVLLIVGWFVFIRPDAAEEFTFSDETSTSTEGEESAETTDTSSGEAEATTTTAEVVSSAEVTAVDGLWTISQGSEAGYRVVEDLRGITDFEATGRTSNVTGSVTVAGTTVSEAGFDVDVASITSDDGTRDSQFVGPIMNTSEFPTATFTLTQPFELDEATVLAGDVFSTEIVGDLTMRGVTNSVTIPLEAKLIDNTIEVIGSVTLPFSDFGIENPSNRFVTVRDEGAIEFKLVLAK